MSGRADFRRNESAPMLIRPISMAARAFLRSVRLSPGRQLPICAARRHLALECRQAGYIRISPDGGVAHLAEDGQAYLDALMRAD